MDERNKNMIIDIKKYCMKETSFLELVDDAPYVFLIDFYIFAYLFHPIIFTAQIIL